MVLRTTNEEPSLWESGLPEEALGLPGELERVDALLVDAAFFAPFADHVHPVMGRPSIPVGRYLRLTALKFRYDLGYEALAGRWPIRSRGSGSVASLLAGGCPMPRS